MQVYVQVQYCFELCQRFNCYNTLVLQWILKITFSVLSHVGNRWFKSTIHQNLLFMLDTPGQSTGFTIHPLHRASKSSSTKYSVHKPDHGVCSFIFGTESLFTCTSQKMPQKLVKRYVVRSVTTTILLIECSRVSIKLPSGLWLAGH